MILKQIDKFVSKQSVAGYLFILPSLINFSMFVFLPLIVTSLISLLDFDMMFNNINFIGLDNYKRLILDERFWNSLYNTVYFTLISVPIQISLAFVVAIWINKKNTINNIFKTVFFLPVICSMTVISIIWTFLLDNDIGIVTYYLNRIGVKTIAWLNDPVWAMPAVIGISIWKNFGFNMVILMAGLDGISDSYYEASSIDGAGKIRQLIYITIPMLLPTLGFVIITSVISSFQVFDQVFIMTRGGPLFKTETIVQYIYHTGFENFEMAYASSIAEILFVIIMLASLLMLRFLKKREIDY